MPDCKEKILSEDYVDWVIDFPLDEIFSSYREELDYCYQEISDGFGVISINRNQMPDITLLSSDYHYFPDLLGLQQEGQAGVLTESSIQSAHAVPGTASGLSSSSGPGSSFEPGAPSGRLFDPSPLIASGITQVQGAPLNLTGRGVILAFADTGERVIIMSS